MDENDAPKPSCLPEPSSSLRHSSSWNGLQLLLCSAESRKPSSTLFRDQCLKAKFHQSCLFLNAGQFWSPLEQCVFNVQGRSHGGAPLNEITWINVYRFYAFVNATEFFSTDLRDPDKTNRNKITILLYLAAYKVGCQIWSAINLCFFLSLNRVAV